MKPTVDILTFADQLQSRVKERIDDPNTGQDELTRIGSLLSFIRGIIAELKTFTSTYKFTDETEEIKFFKEAKPVLLSQYFYYRKIFEIRLFDSFKDLKSRQSNYYNLLQRLERFVSKNKEFYEYCVTGTTYLDKHYFTRNKLPGNSIDRDEHFTTTYDTKLAKILANELSKKFILEALEKTSVERSGGSTLVWTASKTALIELIYALYAAQVFNGGATDIRQLALEIERCFNINAGNCYRVFQDIRTRKGNQTMFLDILKSKLLTYIDRIDS